MHFHIYLRIYIGTAFGKVLFKHTLKLNIYVSFNLEIKIWEYILKKINHIFFIHEQGTVFHRNSPKMGY